MLRTYGNSPKKAEGTLQMSLNLALSWWRDIGRGRGSWYRHEETSGRFGRDVQLLRRCQAGKRPLNQEAQVLEKQGTGAPLEPRERKVPAFSLGDPFQMSSSRSKGSNRQLMWLGWAPWKGRVHKGSASRQGAGALSMTEPGLPVFPQARSFHSRNKKIATWSLTLACPVLSSPVQLLYW